MAAPLPFLHQIWMDVADEPNARPQIPAAVRDSMRQCGAVLRAVSPVIWNGATMRAFVARHLPEYLGLYDRYPRWIYRCDMFRYLVLWILGGIYLDADIECLRDFGDKTSADVFLVLEDPRDVGGEFRISNAIMAAKSGARFFRYVLEQLADAVPGDGPLETTGPVFLTRCYLDWPHKEDITVCADMPRFFSRHPAPDAYTIHHFAHSWASAPNATNQPPSSAHRPRSAALWPTAFVLLVVAATVAIFVARAHARGFEGGAPAPLRARG